MNPYTPLDGYDLTGRVRQTFVRGQLVYRLEDDGAELFGDAGLGRHAKRESKVGR
jgi:hypothetical protein